jgi:outer membrane protein TolC
MKQKRKSQMYIDVSLLKVNSNKIKQNLMKVSGNFILCITILLFCLIYTSNNAFAEKLTVKDCVKTALANHPDIKASQGNIRKADAKIQQALSDYYPQISAYGNATKYYYPSVTSFLQSSGSTTTTSSSSGTGSYTQSGINSYNGPVRYTCYTNDISLSQKIYDFGKTKYNVTVAKEGLNSARYDFITTQFQIVLQAKQAYYQAISAKKFQEIKQEAVIQQEEHLKKASGFFKQGLKSKIEVSKSETDLAKAKIDLIKAQNSYKVQLATLSNAMGFRETKVYELDDQLPILALEIDLDKSYDSAMKNRPELKKFSANIRGSLAQKRQAQVQNLPDISWNAAGNWDGYKMPPPSYWTYGLQITFTIFDGFLASGKAKEAQESVNVLKEQAESKIQSIYLEVNQNYLNLHESKEQIEAAKTSLCSAEENFRLASRRYEVGLGDSIEFYDARVSLTQAKSDLLTALTDYQISRAKLLNAIGVMSED